MKRNMSAIILFVAFTSLISTRGIAQMVVQACFSPQAKCSAHILREIELAKKELLVAVYAFTSEDLASALIQAKKRGVVVQVVVDREFDLANENSKAKFFESQKIPVRRISGVRGISNQKEAGLMHQKFAIIDSRIIFTGSYNWTYSAENLNDENLLFFRDAGPLAEEYRKAFFRLWERKF
jgi:phosphatidylserine/phosphatidylglycerophosphate/cardiolipin synthase-like enzyme